MNSRKSRLRTCLKIAIPVILLLGIILYFALPNISVEDILNYTPANPVLAAGVFLILFTLKSLVIVFPVKWLEIAVGHLFPVWAALLINFAGIFIDLTIPYWNGYYAGMDMIEKLAARYPKFQAVLNRQKDNSLFLCFFLRIIGLPMDLLSMYFGASRVGYARHMLGGYLGYIPKLILYTIWGNSISDPGSNMFWISTGGILLISWGSFLLYTLYKKKLDKKKAGEKEGN